MAYYVNGTLISGANTLPKMTMAEYLALPSDQRPTYWECTDKDYVDIAAENVSFDNTGTSLSSTNVEGAIKEFGVVKKGTFTFTTDASGSWAGTVSISGYPLKAGELLSAYLDRGSLSALRNIECLMYGYGGYVFKCIDNGNPIANTQVTATCVYLKTP